MADDSPTLLAIDIGSTMVKLAVLSPEGDLISQSFHPRDFSAGIARQVSDLTEDWDPCERYICSSANGGLRLGIISLTQRFSGTELRNQTLLAGANPVFVRSMNEHAEPSANVDVLLIGGGIDCEIPGPMATQLADMDLSSYRYSSLVYAGNRFLAGQFLSRYPQAKVIDNPLSHDLRATYMTVYETIRRSYLDDLVHKEGVSELQSNLGHVIRPTPEIVNRGFRRAVSGDTPLPVFGPCLLIDIGGATTDLHYTVEVVKDDSPEQPSRGSSVARYVFTDLGIYASKDSTMLQLRSHHRTHEFLTRCIDGDTTDTYRKLREGEDNTSAEMLAYACLFFALERFVEGSGPGLPIADSGKLSQIILTGGGAQIMSTATAARIAGLVCGRHEPTIAIDRDYKIWTYGVMAPGDISKKVSDEEEFDEL